MDSEINQLKKLSIGWSIFADISLGLGYMNDFHEILNLDQPLVTKLQKLPKEADLNLKFHENSSYLLNEVRYWQNSTTQ